jgi:hypothetical protein
MARLFVLTSLSLLCTASFSCESLNIPPAPDLQPVLNAYERPSAVVDGEIMGEVADEIAEAAEEIEDSEVFDEILEVIIEVQQELEMNTNENGELVLDGTCVGGANEGSACTDDADCPPDGTCGGLTFPSPNGGVRINFICDGWDERQFEPDYEADPDPANGTITLTMTLDSGGIGRVVWGTADNCRYLVPIGGENFRASYHGDVAVDLGDPVPLDEDITELLVTFVVDGIIGFDPIGVDESPFPIDQSFRVKLADTTGLEILVDIGEQPLEETFTYFFQGTAQGLRALNGTFGCSLEDMECFDESGTLFSW